MILANKCEIDTFSLQLFILIYPAILSNVHHVMPFELMKGTFAFEI